MPSPTSELILQNLETTLEGITVAAGYRTTVVRVDRLIKTWNETPPGHRPWIGIVPDECSVNYGSSSNHGMVDWEIHLVACTGGATPILRAQALENLVDDLFVALHTDTYRGGNAITTEILRWQHDGAAEAGQGSLDMTIRVRYRRGFSAS